MKSMKKLFRKLQIRFTYWYIRKGYKFTYFIIGHTAWDCPFWVRPLLVFFDPWIYITKDIIEGIVKNSWRDSGNTNSG